MKFSLSLILNLLQLVPVVIAGVKNIGAEKDWRTMAHDALLLASGVAATVDPADTGTIQGISSLVNSAIDLHLQSAPAAIAKPALTQ